MQNIIADTMHYPLEGVVPYETGLVFHELVLVDKLIDFHYFNEIIRNFNYQLETNKPTFITKDNLSPNTLKCTLSWKVQSEAKFSQLFMFIYTYIHYLFIIYILQCIFIESLSFICF